MGAEGSFRDYVTIRYAKQIIGTYINELDELSKISYGIPLVELMIIIPGF